MLYSRARLCGALATVLVLPVYRAQAQSQLPAILEGTAAAARRVPPPVQRAGMAAQNGVAAQVIAVTADSEHLARPPETGPSTDLPRPFAAFSETARSLGDSLVSLARAQIGRRYRLGGASPQHGFDCSGLVRYVMAALNIELPRTARDQARTGTTVPRDTMQLRPGDLVTFGSTRRISHIGIYVGDGRFVQASSAAGRVIETPLIRRLVRGVKPWRGVRRVMPADSTVAVPEASLPSERGDAG